MFHYATGGEEAVGKVKAKLKFNQVEDWWGAVGPFGPTSTLTHQWRLKLVPHVPPNA